MSRSPNPQSPNIGTGPKGAKTAFKRGKAAAKAGLPITACPYSVGKIVANELNPGARWKAHWERGYNSVKPPAPKPETP